MLTFSQLKQDVISLINVDEDNIQEVRKAVSDINTGIKLFQNAVRRYWVRQERETNLIQGKSLYRFPRDMVRVVDVRIKDGDNYYPITLVHNIEDWHKLTGSQSTGKPECYIIKNGTEMELYPTPADDVPNGMVVTFEPRMQDLGLADREVNVSLTENSPRVTAAQDSFVRSMENNGWLQVTDGSDGNWYKVAKVVNAREIRLETPYQGLTATTRVKIGQCPQFPEEYHQAPVYYAAQQYFLMRKDLDSANMYKQLFDNMVQEYKTVYGMTTTSGFIQGGSSMMGRERVTDPVRSIW